VLRVRRSSFPIEATALTRDVTPDSRLIEITQVVKHPHQHPSEEDAAESVISEPGIGAGITAHGHTGSLLFVQESELDNEIGAPAVGDVLPADEAVPYEAETAPEYKPVDVAEPVSIFVALTRQLC